jgi:hypothetical protein
MKEHLIAAVSGRTPVDDRERATISRFLVERHELGATRSTSMRSPSTRLPRG